MIPALVADMRNWTPYETMSRDCVHVCIVCMYVYMKYDSSACGRHAKLDAVRHYGPRLCVCMYCVYVCIYEI